VSDTSDSAPIESSQWASPTAVATLDPVWQPPSDSGSGNGGDGTGSSSGSATPPPARSRSGGPIALFLLVAVAAFLIAGPVRSHFVATRSTTGVAAPTLTPAPTRPTVVSPAPSAGGGATSSSGTLSQVEIASIGAKVNRGVVNINTELGFQGGSAAGTGMVLTSSGEVLTNNHVVLGATTITVTVVDTGRTYTARVVGTAPTQDIAVLQLDGASGLKTISASTATVSIGDLVVATGNAGGRGGTPSVVSGTVVDTGQTITATDENGSNPQTLTDLIQVSAPIESGDSGGPLANRAGEVIGMDSAAEVSGTRFRTTSSAGYAIPIAKALSVVKQIESGKASATVHIGLPAFLGVQIADGGTTRRGVPAPTQAVIAGVERGTPAASIGLAAGDTITSVNGQAVDSPTRLTTLLQAAHPGDQVAIGWTDQSGTAHTARPTLIAGPAD